MIVVSLLMVVVESVLRARARLLGEQGRQLVAQGLAGARGHAQERVLALETRPNHLQLGGEGECTTETHATRHTQHTRLTWRGRKEE